MLPGGLDVLGIFAVSEPDAMKMAQAKLRQVCIHASNESEEIFYTNTDQSLT